MPDLRREVSAADIEPGRRAAAFAFAMAGAGLGFVLAAYLVAYLSTQSTDAGLQALAFYSFLMFALVMAPMCHLVGLVAGTRSFGSSRLISIGATLSNAALLLAGPALTAWVWRSSAG